MKQEKQINEVESLLLELDERMTETVYQKYLEGEIDQENFEEINKNISKWSLDVEILLLFSQKIFGLNPQE